MADDLPPGFVVQDAPSAPHGSGGSDLPPGFVVQDGLEPDTSSITKMAKQNFANPEGANGFWAGLKNGLEESSSAVLFHKPTVVPPEQADMFYRIAHGAGMALGDIPAYVAGGIGGAFAGSAVAPGPGALVGGWAGAGALPPMIRKWMMDRYDKGEIQDGSDALGRVGGAILEGAKGAAVNMATLGVGEKLGPIASEMGGALVGTAAKTAAEVATMTTAASALEGRMPHAQDFIDNAFVVAGTHTIMGPVTSTAKTLRTIYAATGLHPAEVAEMSMEDPVLAQKLRSTQNPGVPQETIDAAPKEEVSENDTKWKAENPEPKQVPAPEVTGHPDFAEGQPVGQVSVPQMEVTPELPKAPQESTSEPPPPGSLDEAKAYIDSKIVPMPDNVPAPMTWDKIQQRVLDQMHGLGVLAKQLAQGKELTALTDPYILGRLTAGTNSVFKSALEGNGPIDPLTRQPIEGLKSHKEIFKGVDMAGFQRWLVAKRVVEKAGQGVEAFGEGTDTQKAQMVADAGEKQFSGVNKDYQAWKDSFIDYGTKLGLFGKEQAQAIKDANQNHIFFKRVFEGQENYGPGGKNLKVNNPVKGFKGDESDIADPMKNDLLNSYKIMQAADRNRVINAVAKLASDNPEAAARPDSLFQKAAPKFQKFNITGEEVNQKMGVQGLAPDATSADFFRAKQERLGDNQVQSFVDGKRVVWDTTPMAAEAIKGITDSSQADVLSKFINGPGRLLRTMQMMYPVFWERHFVRSQENAAATTPLSALGQEPLIHMHKAIAGMFQNSDDYQQFLASGGANESSSNVFDLIDKNTSALEKKTNFMDSMWNGVKSIPESVILGFHKMEESLHFAKYLASRGSDQSPESIARAGFDARSVNGDIAMRGSSNLVRWYSAATPFWAQHMAGLAETGKAFQKDFGGTFAKMAAIYTLPAIANWWMNKDDERWKDLPPWQKTMSIPIFTDKWEDAPAGVAPPEKNTAYSRVLPDGRVQINNGGSWKVPMFETGMAFASLPVAALDAMYNKNPDAFKGFGEALFHTAMPLDIPAALHPILEHFANKSTLTGNPIIPSSMEGRENIEPQMKYTDYTSQSAKVMGKLIHQIPVVGNTDLAAPMMIENYIRSWTGGPGMLALKLADKGLQSLPSSARSTLGVADPVTKPDGTWADNPWTMAFAIRNPGMSAAPVRQMFDNYDKYLETKNTVAALKKRGDFDQLDKYQQDTENQKNLIPQDNAHKAVMNMSQYLREITKDPDMNAHDKRQLYDWTMIQLIQTARAQNDARDQMRADFDQAGAAQ